MKSNWTLRENKEGFDYSKFKKYEISDHIARIIHDRGIDTSSKIERFINPSLRNMHDPFLLPNMDEASKRLCYAIKNREKILLFGDYDVDGITGSSILFKALKILGANVQAYVPNRFKDGYGISPDPLIRVFEKDSRPDVVVSIDNGIVAFDASDFLYSNNIDFIVADHHRMADDGSLPRGILVHPEIPDSLYPNKSLCGAGVSFKIAWGVFKQYFNCFGSGKSLPKEYRDILKGLTSLAAMGTIADIMPLTEENRDIVFHGLRFMNRSGLTGLTSLVKESLDDLRKPVKSGQVAFQVAPRINAAGRLGSGQKAFELLVETDITKTESLAEELTKDNNLRKEIELKIANSAFSQVIEVYGASPIHAGLVVYDHDWHEGVVGIVASRVVERFGRPSIVLSILEDNETVKGSGRGAFGVDMKDALDDCSDLLLKYGGHGAAVGLTMKACHLDEFRERFALACARQMGFDKAEVPDLVPEFKIDAEVKLSEVNYKFINDLNLLEPCGMGNKKPIFSSTVKFAVAPRLIGKEKNHINFSVEQDGVVMKCLFWNSLDYFESLEKLSKSPIRHPFRIAFKPDINEYRGRKSINLSIVSISLPDNLD